MRAAIYARELPDPSDEPTKGLDDQVNELIVLAHWEGVEVGEVFYEALAAAPRRRRPAFERMARAVRGGGIDGVLIRSTDRLALDSQEAATLAGLLRKGELRFVVTPRRVYRPKDVEEPDAFWE